MLDLEPWESLPDTRSLELLLRSLGQFQFLSLGLRGAEMLSVHSPMLLNITITIYTCERTWAGLLLPRVVKVGVWGTVRRGAGDADLTSKRD